MAFPVDPFAIAISRTLQLKGFMRTGTTILQVIGDGYPRQAAEGTDETRRTFTLFEQQQICADIIEQNIILPYAAWEACALQLGEEELMPESWIDERQLEDHLQITTAAGGSRQLGSFAYRKPIEGLRDTISRLRGMDPPTPTGGRSPPSPPSSGGGTGASMIRAGHSRAISTQRSAPYAVSTWIETADHDAGMFAQRSFEQRLPFFKVSPQLSFPKRLVEVQFTEDEALDQENEEAKGFDI
ncbi:hypothetical protein [Rhizobium leguminosarum]|uniref:hypothetical protein n=1 Tax=Rhizobium leguminosarum TaxID=384 RepID=UPI001C962070|nr:hypothetical protein [Rhizobium leguminosarum]MBY5626363.1 hypothetical protein [Rhizobium leguminosarum]